MRSNESKHQESRVGAAEIVMVFTQFSSSPVGDHTFTGNLTRHLTRQKIPTAPVLLFVLAPDTGQSVSLF
jgi:hypothetical protein